jgi:hypothetical protein
MVALVVVGTAAAYVTTAESRAARLARRAAILEYEWSIEGRARLACRFACSLDYLYAFACAGRRSQSRPMTT